MVTRLSRFLFLVLPAVLLGQNHTIENGNVLIPLSDISLTIQKITIDDVRFFVGKKTDGTVFSHFDKCNVCGPAGFTQSADEVRCNQCGKSYNIESLGVHKEDGCWPIFLPAEVIEDNLVIKTSDIGITTSILYDRSTAQNASPSHQLIQNGSSFSQIRLISKGTFTIMLVNSRGECIRNETIKNEGATHYRLSSDRLAAGHYFVHITFSSRTSSYRFTVR